MIKSYVICFLIYCLLLNYANSYESVECQKRTYFRDSFVCVCNSTHCDDVQQLDNSLADDEATIYTTSLKNDRLTKSQKKTVRNNGSKRIKDPSATQINVFPDQKHQKIIGFGGAITDASMKIRDDILKSNTSRGLDTVLFSQYYGPSGISYNIGRVPISSCDFSVTNYSYLDQEGDFELKSFSLSKFEYNKWDFLANAQRVSSSALRLFSSSWSAPAWIKTNGQMQGGGEIKNEDKYYELYAKYFIRFFEEYTKRGVTFWATTIENEPSMAGVVSWQNKQREFIIRFLKPLLKQNPVTKDLKVMVHDDFRGDLLSSAKIYLKDDNSYFDGYAFHWYGGGNFDQVNATYQLNSDKFLLMTEACNAYSTRHAPQLGYWQFAENYADDIIQTLLNNGAGWIDWNIWLDEQGGPNWVKNYVDSPIIVNVTAGEFYKNPMYYIMGHFSKFVLPGSNRIWIEVSKPDSQLEVIGFEDPNQNIVVVMLNKSPNQDFNLIISIGNKINKHLEITLQSKSIKTIIWKP